MSSFKTFQACFSDKNQQFISHVHDMHCNLNVESFNLKLQNWDTMKQNWVAKEWKLDIDLKLTGTLPETSNILHFLVPGSNGEHGWRIPAIFCRKNKPILDIYSSVGDNHVHSYKTKELNLNQWYSFRSFSSWNTLNKWTL